MLYVFMTQQNQLLKDGMDKDSSEGPENVSAGT